MTCPADSGSAIAKHIQWCQQRNLRPATISGRERLLRALAAEIGPLPGATVDQLGAWRASLTVAPDTAANYVSHVREFYRWLQVIEEARDDDPSRRLVMPRLGTRLPRPIATDDLMAALAQAPARIRPWLVLAAWGGLRCVEIALLRRERVLERATPRPYILVAADATKGQAERVVRMCGFVLAELVPVLPRSGWVFRRYDGRPGPNRANRISGEGNEYLRGLGLADTMHSLRHWFGSEGYAATRDIRAVQEAMGHRSVRSTQGYTLLSGSAHDAVVDGLPVPGRANTSQLSQSVLQ